MDPIERERDMNQWLESALGQYSKAEPRPGLENRVLANLQAERNRIASRRRWWAAGTAAALAAMMAAVWIGESARERSPVPTVGKSSSHQEEFRASIQAGTTPQAAPLARAYTAREVAKRKPANRPMHYAAGTTPKLAQFPSPQPLSEQERILMSYVAIYPKHAALVAQARTEALRQDRAEEMSAPDSSGDESSEQRVR